MTIAQWEIPPSTLNWLSKIPLSSSAIVLLRHSVRDHLAPDDVGYTMPITEAGEDLARQLGVVMADRLRTVHTSPLTRCVQTAEALCQGAQAKLSIVEDRLLGDPGVFVIDGERAWSNWLELEHEGVMEHLVSKDFALPGMADPDAAARLLVSHMLAVAEERAGLHVFVTHDTLVMAAAARLLGEPLSIEAWPWFLEGAFFWRDDGQLMTGYREHLRRCQATELRQLDERHAIDFARREIAQTLGTNIDAQFFLAGGAFKTLLTGCSPSDLDLWAPSKRDREKLISDLTARGACQIEERHYSDAFTIGGRIVEVSHKIQSLEKTLVGFDIALSAIAVEHRPDGEWQAFIHPLAIESVAQRQVLLLKPLANWRHSLTTLERMRRYATELGYVIPPQEEGEIWQVFDSQSEDMQSGMLERFKRMTSGGQGVLEEVLCRLA